MEAWCCRRLPSIGEYKQRPRWSFQAAHLKNKKTNKNKKNFQALVIVVHLFQIENFIKPSAFFALNNSLFSDWSFVSRNFLKLAVSKSETKANFAIKGENQRPTRGSFLSEDCKTKQQKNGIIIMTDFFTTYKVSLVALMCLVQGNARLLRRLLENAACVSCLFVYASRFYSVRRH